MEKIRWCLKQNRGLKIIEPNENLSKAYILKAENSLKASVVLKNIVEWEISSSYYSMYFSLYAILMKIGVKSEIHSCIIEFMKEFLKEYFSEEEVLLLEQAQKARVELQYYSVNNITEELYNKIISRRTSFFIKCKEILKKINDFEIKKMRERLGEL